jgi:hypothetical protein
MSGRLWLENVERELSRGRLPRQEVARLVAELSDHLADVMESRSATGPGPVCQAASAVSSPDLTEENMSMEARVVESLGSPAAIAETAVREFRRRRNPLSRSRLAAFCTFVLLPLPALCLAWTATFAGLALVGEVLDRVGVTDPSANHEVTGLYLFLGTLLLNCVVLAPAAGVAALFGRLARKTARRWRWGLAACLLVALGTALVTTDATFSELPGESTITFGLGIDTLRFSALGQFLIPLAVGLLVLRRPPQAADPAARPTAA